MCSHSPKLITSHIFISSFFYFDKLSDVFSIPVFPEPSTLPESPGNIFKHSDSGTKTMQDSDLLGLGLGLVISVFKMLPR